MILEVDADDDRSPLIAGLVNVTVDEVLRKRECVFTNFKYPLKYWGHQPGWNRFPVHTSKQEATRKIFEEGRLCCRVVYIRFMNRNGKDTSGVVRHLYSEEADKIDSASPVSGPGLSREHSLIIVDDDEGDVVTVTEGLQRGRKRQARSDSIEILESPPKRKPSLLVKDLRYTLGDAFCGAGGASQGARQAGLHVTWGLDNDEDAITAYQLNHPGAWPLCQNAHDFPPSGYDTKDLHVDILHLSPPCCYWSPAQ